MLQGLNILVSIFRREQESDDAIGGSAQRRTPVRADVPARIGATRSPQALRVQGIESSDLFDCVMQSADLVDIDVQFDDVVIPQDGQYKNREFAVLAVQDDSIADSPDDYRRHKFLSLRRIEKARELQ